jgi:hypothetical protein
VSYTELLRLAFAATRGIGANCPLGPCCLGNRGVMQLSATLLAEVSASRFKRENADDVVDRTTKGMLSIKLLTPEQAESKIVSRQLLRVPYSYPVPTIGRDRALAGLNPWVTKQEIYSRGRFGALRYEVGSTSSPNTSRRGTPEPGTHLGPAQGEEARVRIA